MSCSLGPGEVEKVGSDSTASSLVFLEENADLPLMVAVGAQEEVAKGCLTMSSGSETKNAAVESTVPTEPQRASSETSNSPTIKAARLSCEEPTVSSTQQAPNSTPPSAENQSSSKTTVDHHKSSLARESMPKVSFTLFRGGSEKSPSQRQSSRGASCSPGTVREKLMESYALRIQQVDAELRELKEKRQALENEPNRTRESHLEHQRTVISKQKSQLLSHIIIPNLYKGTPFENITYQPNSPSASYREDLSNHVKGTRHSRNQEAKKPGDQAKKHQNRSLGMEKRGKAGGAAKFDSALAMGCFLLCDARKAYTIPRGRRFMDFVNCGDHSVLDCSVRSTKKRVVDENGVERVIYERVRYSSPGPCAYTPLYAKLSNRKR